MDEAKPMIVPSLLQSPKRTGECLLTLASPTPSTIAAAQRRKATMDEARKPYAVRRRRPEPKQGLSAKLSDSL